jgi:hypothetical protein
MQGLVTFLKALAVMLLAAFGASIAHWNATQKDGSFGVGLGVFVLVGALILYRRWFCGPHGRSGGNATSVG